MSIGKGIRFLIIHLGLGNGFITEAKYILINSEFITEIFKN
jgi:hypothetical protein